MVTIRLPCCTASCEVNWWSFCHVI